MKKILVLGAAGNVGRSLVFELAARGADVRAAVHRRAKKEFVDRGVGITPFDFFNPATYDEAFSEVDTLFLMTPAIPQMVKITKTILPAAKISGIKHVIKLSALGGDSTGPQMAFGKWHRESEVLVEQSGIEFTFLRANAFMQNFVQFYGQSIRKNHGFYLSAEEGKVAYVDAADVGKAAAEVALNGPAHFGKTYHLSGPEALDHHSIARVLSQVVETDVSYFPISEARAEVAFGKVGIPESQRRALHEMYQFYREGGAQEVSTDFKVITGKLPTALEIFFLKHKNALVDAPVFGTNANVGSP